MTNSVDGPSLLQARDTRNHHRFHSFQNSPALDDRSDRAEIDSRSPSDEVLKLHARQVVVVHTVSVLQVIDNNGAVVGHSTLLPEPVLEIPNPAAVVTAGLGEVDDRLADLGDGALPTPFDPLGSPTPSATEPLLSDTDTLTSPPATSSTGIPLLTGAFNSTRLYGNSTGLFLNTTRSTSTRSKSSSQLVTLFSDAPTETAGGAGGFNANGIPAGVPPVPTSSPPAAPTGGSGLTPAAQSAVIGGVVGSVAGIALVALVLMFVLKWKRNHRSGLMLLTDGDEKGGRRDLFAGSKPPGSGGGSGGEGSIPFAIPATLASLTGPRRIEEGPKESATAEKGFYRVSGKKLISVLESGGDGYSDPRHSAMSGVSDYRHSEAFLGTSFGGQKLQLGSPMRPESGVPIFRSGPNRTPVTAGSPFSDAFQRPVTPPTINPLGREVTGGGRQSSRGSPSRFSEAM